MSDEKKVIEPCDGTPEGCHGDSDNCGKDPSECHANSSFSEKKSEGNLDDCLGKSLEQLSTAFMASAKRWEMIVCPALFAFIILAAYGFFLIYSLTEDISRVADDMGQITQHMEQISTQVNSISKNMVVMTQTLDSQLASMDSMTYQIRGMNISMNQMRYDFSVLNNSVSRPMSFMNTFMPW